MSKTLLIVHHTPSPATRELLEAVLAGANDPEIDAVGAVSSIDRVVTGLSLAKAADALEITGELDAGTRERAYELGGTLAATLMQ